MRIEATRGFSQGRVVAVGGAGCAERRRVNFERLVDGEETTAWSQGLGAYGAILAGQAELGNLHV